MSSEGRSVARLDEVCDVILGQPPPGESYNTDSQGLPCFQGKAEFGDGYPMPVKWCTKPSKLAEKDAVLISVRAPVDPTNLCPGKACVDRGLAALSPRDKIPSRYGLYALRIAHLTAEKFVEIEFPLPPLAEQHRIVDEMERRLSIIAGLEVSLAANTQRIANLRKSILADGFHESPASQDKHRQREIERL